MAGLITAYYLKDYYLISKKDNVGGQFNSTFQLGPRFIKFNLNLKKLLVKLKINYSIKPIKVGYITGLLIKDYITKKELSSYNKKVGRKTNIKGSLNDNLQVMKILDFDMKELIDKLELILKSENRIIYDEVVKIDLKNKRLYVGEKKDNRATYSYDKLISTIHYKDFCKLSRIKCDAKFGDIYFYLVDKKYFEIVQNLNDYSFVYVIDNSDINRITILKDKLVFESNKKMKNNHLILDNHILKNAKLLKNYSIKKIKNVVFLGRYAELNQEIRVNNLVDKILEIKKHEN